MHVHIVHFVRVGNKRERGLRPVILRLSLSSQFSQNPKLLNTLLAAHPRTLVEAAPRDRLWGIGLGASNPKARNRWQWRGRNLLGEILTEVREELRKGRATGVPLNVSGHHEEEGPKDETE